MTSEKFIDVAELYIGTQEKSVQHFDLLSIYNSQDPLPRGYKATSYDPWCGIFVSAVAIKSGCASLIPCECSCTLMRNKAKDMGIWYDSKDLKNPPPASIIMWDYDPNKSNGPDHVGIVLNSEADRITVIDGNWKNQVCLRAVDRSNIHGYIVPKYKDSSVPRNTLGELTCPHCGKTIKLYNE